MFYRSQIATFVENISLVTSQRSLVNAMIQVALDRVSQYYDWPFYMDYRNGVIQTVATYSAGTISVTNGSTSIDSAGTAFTSVMVGRKIRVQNEKPYYRITAVNGASGVGAITIDVPYQGTTATLQSYEIFKDEYLLKADVDKQKIMRQIQNGIAVIELSPKRFDEIFPTPQSYSDPMWSIIIGTANSTYSSGTISASGTALTGVGTNWLSADGLGHLSKITIGNSVFTVKSVNSDTSITTYESMGTISAGTTYSILIDNIVTQLYQIPNNNRNLYYRYFRQPNPLVNDADLPDMPTQFHHLLIDGCLSQMWRQKGDLTNQADAENRFISGLNLMKQKLGSFAPDRVSQRKSADSYRRRGITRGLEPSAYDMRYSG